MRNEASRNLYKIMWNIGFTPHTILIVTWPESRKMSVICQIRTFFARYGLGFVIAAGFFGAGSIYILSASGIRFGFSLLWAVLLSGGIGVKAQSMSILVGIHRKPLMVLIRERVGRPLAFVLALYLSANAMLWILELRAADGMALSMLFGGRISWEILNYTTGALTIVFIMTNAYNRFEKYIMGFLFLTVLCFIAIVFLDPPTPRELLIGLAPRFFYGALTQEYMVLLMCIVGTTVLWPNLFLQSTIVKEKGWCNSTDYQFAVRDTIIGFSIGILGSVAILTGSATIIRPLGIDKLETFITPALILSNRVGIAGSALFLVGLFFAAFNSSIVITTTLVYILHQAYGKTVNFGDRGFATSFVILSAIGSAFPTVAHFTGLSIVDAIILFPGINGALGLPLVILFLFGFKFALVPHRTWRGALSNVLDMCIIIVTFLIAIRSIRSLVSFLLD